MAHLTCAEALRTLLDQVDYTAEAPACGITEMVGAVLPKEVIALCHDALDWEVTLGPKTKAPMFLQRLLESHRRLVEALQNAKGLPLAAQAELGFSMGLLGMPRPHQSA